MAKEKAKPEGGHDTVDVSPRKPSEVKKEMKTVKAVEKKGDK